MDLKEKFITEMEKELQPLQLEESELQCVIKTYIDIVSPSFSNKFDVFKDVTNLKKHLHSNNSMIEDVLLSECGFEAYETYKQKIDSSFIDNIIKRIS